MRGRSYGQRILMRVLAVVACLAVVAVGLWFWWRSRELPPSRDVPKIQVAQRDLPITIADLSTTFQGPVQRTDGAEEWMVMSVTGVRSASDPVSFSYVLNSSDHQLRADDGTFSLRLREVRFGGFRGEITRSPNGVLCLRSGATDSAPRWSLEARGATRADE